MLAIITRPMIIATDAGTSKQFVPRKDEAGEDVPQSISESEFGRLRRAGAASRFIEVNHAEAEAEPSEGSILQGLAKLDVGGDGAFSQGAQTEPTPTGSGEAGSEGGSSGVTSQLPVKPAKGRKPKA